MIQKATRFIFEGYARATASQAMVFSYVTELESGERLRHEERLLFPKTTHEQWDAIPGPLLERLLQTLHLLLGVSYWKMHCAPQIEIHGYTLTRSQADFWNTIYTKGLGEFFFKNQIDYRGLVNFPFTEAGAPEAIVFPRAHRSLLPIGGGKDSIVSLEWMKEHNKPFVLFSLKSADVQRDLATKTGKEYLTVDRVLDPDMLTRTQNGEAYNGHLPISSVYAFVGVLVAALQDFDTIVFSNERSADIGNVEYLGQEINHQWSKSLEAEEMIKSYVHTYLTPSITPFSLLRNLYEIEIVRRFSLYPEYFHSFSSCNRNFATSAPTPERKGHAYWCGVCPKCAFVFACLAAFLPKATVIDIFGKNLFGDATLVPLYKSLLGIESFKPFECVGTPDEMKLALYRAHAKGEYASDVVMMLFADMVLPGIANIQTLEQELLGGEIRTDLL